MGNELVYRILRGGWVALIILLLFAAVYYITPLVSPFIIGWVIAYALNPFVNLLQNKAKLPRWLAVAIALLLFLGIAVAIVSVLVTNIVIEIGYLAETIQNNIEKWRQDFVRLLNSDYLQHLVNQFTTFYNENPKYQETINKNLTATASKLADTGSYIIGAFFNGLLAFLTSLPNIATVMVIALLAAFFISKDFYRIAAKLSSWFPERAKKTTHAIWLDLRKALFGYLRAQFILISITAIVVIIGLLILRVEYAVTIGLITGLVDLLPYLGTGAIMVPWIIFVFLHGNVPLGIGLSVLYGIILVARQLIEPKVLATSVGLDPLATLIAMVVGLNLFGVLGLILGPVTLVLLTAFHKANVFRDIGRYITTGKFAS